MTGSMHLPWLWETWPSKHSVSCTLDSLLVTPYGSEDCSLSPAWDWRPWGSDSPMPVEPGQRTGPALCNPEVPHQTWDGAQVAIIMTTLRPWCPQTWLARSLGGWSHAIFTTPTFPSSSSRADRWAHTAFYLARVEQRPCSLCSIHWFLQKQLGPWDHSVHRSSWLGVWAGRHLHFLKSWSSLKMAVVVLSVWGRGVEYFHCLQTLKVSAFVSALAQFFRFSKYTQVKVQTAVYSFLVPYLQLYTILVPIFFSLPRVLFISVLISHLYTCGVIFLCGIHHVLPLYLWIHVRLHLSKAQVEKPSVRVSHWSDILLGTAWIDSNVPG